MLALVYYKLLYFRTKEIADQKVTVELAIKVDKGTRTITYKGKGKNKKEAKLAAAKAAVFEKNQQIMEV